MTTLFLVVAIIFWAFLAAFMASAGWDAARARRGFRYLACLTGMMLSTAMVVMLLVEVF